MLSRFHTGDIIEFADELYIVLENFGHSGKVQEYPVTEKSVTVNNFRWEYQGEHAIRLQNGIVPLIKDGLDILKQEYHIDTTKYEVGDVILGWDGTKDSLIELEFKSKETDSTIVFENIHHTVDSIKQYEIKLR